MELDDLIQIEEIRRLKHRYVRYLDTKRWDDLAALWAEDATASWGGGAFAFEGRDDIMEFLLGSAESERFITSHLIGEPEVIIESATTASGSWPLRDEVLMLDEDLVVRGYAYYEDRFVKREGTLLVAHSGYQRIFEEAYPRSSIAGLRLTGTLWDSGGRSTLFDE